MKIIILFMFILIFSNIFADKSILLVGLDTHLSEFLKPNYINSDKEVKDRSMETLAIIRNGDKITIKKKPYLIIPTNNGFKYATLEITEKKNIINSETMEYEKQFKLESSDTKVLISKNLNNIKKILKKENINKKAISTHYEKISFITPNFYITSGFNSYVHGGASWINIDSFIKLNKINKYFKTNSLKAKNYLSEDLYLKYLLQIVNRFYGKSFKIDEALPWSTSINELKDVYVDFTYGKKGIEARVNAKLQSNSSRNTINSTVIKENKSLFNRFKIYNNFKKYEYIQEDYLNLFISHDNISVVALYEDKIKVYDLKTEKLLFENDHGLTFNKVIMAEWAYGKYVKNWEKELD